MAPKFGTSGLRGLVVELTPDLVADHIRAFLAACPVGTGLYVGRDLRPSSPALAEVVIAAARGEGIPVTDCGAVPTPALALAAMGAGSAAVMVTGSHIPADRNGLKFYLPGGEIAKTDEAAILGALGRPAQGRAAALAQRRDVGTLWVDRYVLAFGAGALEGLRIGVWSHSAVSRDLLVQVLQALGAEVVELGRSQEFIPVDTEAVPDWARAQIAAWVAEHRLDALVSTDGDGDRPLLADGAGQVVPGDILGQITARVVGALMVVTPVSSNTGVEAGGFDLVIRTKIGSPHVIAGMARQGDVVGYEANGGFLLGFTAQLPGGALTPLATRDSLLPILAPLSLARAVGGVAPLVAAEPARFTATDRVEDIPTDRSAALLRGLEDPSARAALLSGVEEIEAATDRTDGLRITCASGRVVHLRPSGNAPEFRCYAEAESPQAARDVLTRTLALLQDRLR